VSITAIPREETLTAQGSLREVTAPVDVVPSSTASTLDSASGAAWMRHAAQAKSRSHKFMAVEVNVVSRIEVLRRWRMIEVRERGEKPVDYMYIIESNSTLRVLKL
jgi:hypothetical protein